MTATAPTAEDARMMPMRETGDDRMTQVRDLLIGDYVRANETRMLAIETRLREIDTVVSERLTALQQRIDTLAHETVGERKSAFEDLARGVADLSDKIKAIVR